MCEQRQRQRKRKASMRSHEAFHAAHASTRSPPAQLIQQSVADLRPTCGTYLCMNLSRSHLVALFDMRIHAVWIPTPSGRSSV